MEEEKKDVEEQQEPSPALEGAIASSPEVTEELQEQTTEQATPQKAEEEAQEEVQEEKVPYTRFKEVIDERNFYREKFQQPQVQPQPQPTQDPYAGKTPEEKVFWQEVDDRAEKKAQEALQKINPLIDQGRNELAQMKVQQFRQTHPDIKPNSPDELAIADRIRQGYTPDDAYWSHMGPRGARQAEEKVRQQQKTRLEAKKKANVESGSGIPSTSGLPPKENLTEKDFRKTAEKYLDEAGL